MTTATTTTDRRILIAVLRLITYGGLERSNEVTRLAQQPNQDRINHLTHYYLGLAEKANFDRNKAEHRPLHMAPERLATCVMFAADLGYPIRFAAQGVRGENPTRYTWCLLNAVLAVLVAQTTSHAERITLDQQVTTVAAGLSEQ